MKKFDLNFYSGKRVLVTGHTGFKGTWLCRLLLNMGAQVTGYSLQPPTEPSIFGLAGMDRQMNSITGDIRNLDRLLEVFRENRPEIVLHLAAQPIVRESYKNPVYTYETNDPVGNLLATVQKSSNCDKSYKAPRLDKSNGTYEASPKAMSGVSSAAIANVNLFTSGIVAT